MKPAQSIKFIKGTFNPDEAKEVLLNLLTHKINFHSLKNFSSEERFGKSIEGSQKRIAELQESKEKIVSLVEFAIKENKNIDVVSTIEITLCD
jgi:hypothetical protein